MEFFGTLKAPAVSTLPAAGVVGRLVRLSSDNHIYHDNGVTWDDLNATGGMLVSSTNANPLVVNTFYNLDVSGGSITSTLPTAVGISGQMIRVRKTDATANTITMASTSAQTINESLASTVVLRKNGWVFDFQSDGSNWKLV